MVCSNMDAVVAGEKRFHSVCIIYNLFNFLDVRNGQGDVYEFRIVSLDGNSWNFAAQSGQVTYTYLCFGYAVTYVLFQANKVGFYC